MRRALVAALVLALAAPRAHAQAAPAEYDDAFAALARGDRDEARRLLGIVIQRAPSEPGDPWRGRAGELLDKLGPPPARPTPGHDFRHEVPTQAARAELALFQTVNGIFAGVFLCVAASCDSGGAAVILALGGGGAGLAASLAGTHGGIHPGRALLIDSGTAWGVWHGAALLGILDADSAGAVGGGVLAGQLGGTGLGLALWPVLRPTAGQVALANTVGGWSLALTLFAQGAFIDDLDLDAHKLLASLLVVGDLGLVAGGFLASRTKTSRGRMLLVDAGGICGSLLGSAAVVLIEGNDTSGKDVFRAMLPGAVVGLGLAAWLTRDWDPPELPVSAAIAPVAGGGMAVVGGRF